MESDPVNILTLIHRPRRVNFAFRQVDFRFTCPDGQVETLDKTMIIKMNDGEYVIWAS